MIVPDTVKRSCDWLLKSDIRSKMKPNDALPAGGVRRSYDARRGVYEAFYPEITGYTVSFLQSLARDTGDTRLLDSAIESGEWLLATQNLKGELRGAFPYSVDESTRTTGGWFSFDTAIVARALLELGRQTNRDDFISRAVLAGEWLLTMQESNGAFLSYRGHADSVSWAASGSCLHGKHAVILLELWKETGDRRFRNAAERCLDWLRTLQLPNGAIVSSPGREFVFLHSHCYAAEGLLAGVLHLQSQGLEDAFLSSCMFMRSMQQRQGGFWRYWGADSTSYLKEMGSRFTTLRKHIVPRDVGASSQSIRLLCWAQSLGTADFTGAIDKGVRWLDRHQISNSGASINGAYPASVDEFMGMSRTEQRIYPWVTIFAADAVMLRSRRSKPIDVY